jgi:hypothetical protein
MNASEFFFGVEVETVVAQSTLDHEGLQIGAYHHGIQVPYLPQGWKAERDGSIDTSRGGHACEIVSPILKGAEGLAQVAQVLEILEAKNHVVNKTCGVHIHISIPGGWSAEVLARLTTIVAYCEKGLYAITGTKSRERGIYCGGVRKYGSAQTAKPTLDRSRYHVLNLTNLANGRSPTVEFRAFSGSTSRTKVCGWISVCLGLVERAINAKRCPTWTPKPLQGGWKKAGEGQSEAERLMGYLAWGTGYARIHGGTQYGWISDLISQDQVKAEFRRLAAKYDAMA